ncbi:MAG: hypothetical protein R6W90_01045 [Ignavibacteriaceae bacterium]
MINKFENTINSLTRLINALNDSSNYYYRLLNLNLDYADIIKPLYNQKVDFLNKMLKEYKRLTKKEFPQDYSLANYIITYNNIDLLEECLRTEKKLIDLYSDIMNKDVLWEILPVLAHHNNYLKASKGLLLSYIDDYKRHNKSIIVDYSRHASLVN